MRLAVILQRQRHNVCFVGAISLRLTETTIGTTLHKLPNSSNDVTVLTAEATVS